MAWWECGLRLLSAVVIGCVIGMEREKKHRPAGMRTHVLVCLGAAMVAVIESLLVEETLGMQAATGISVTRGRMAAQVVSGIGFLGAGTIFMSKKRITGLTTAASLWNVACLGLAVGMGYYSIGLAGCLIVLLTLTVMQKLASPSAIKQMEITFTNRQATMTFISQCFAEHGIHVLDVDLHMEKNEENVPAFANVYTIDIPYKVDYGNLLSHMAAYEDIQSIRTVNNNM